MWRHNNIIITTNNSIREEKVFLVCGQYNTGEKDFVLVSALSWLVTATGQRRIYSSIRHVIWWLQWEVVVVHCWGVELRCELFGEAVGTINGPPAERPLSFARTLEEVPSLIPRVPEDRHCGLYY